MSIDWVQSAAKPEFLNHPGIKFDLIGSVEAAKEAFADRRWETCLSKALAAK